MIPTQIDDYQIVRELGSGGMGTVYEAVHIKLSRRVAIKVVRPEHVRDPEVEARFLKEARALAHVAHPSIVQIYTFGVLVDGTAYLVMELLTGESLATRWRRTETGHVLHVELQLIQQIADVLALLHRNGVVHRDLKPDNVMTVPDPAASVQHRAKLVDFGLAKLIRLSGQQSSSSLIMGTPAYMSPEQCRGAGQVDAKTDCYALGVMLYELVSGRLPFESKWAGDLIGMHLHVEPPRLLQLAPQVDQRLSYFIHSLLTKDKNHRPAMAEAAKYLSELLPRLGKHEPAPHPISTALEAALAPTAAELPLPAPVPIPAPQRRPDAASSLIAEAPKEPASQTPPSPQDLTTLFSGAQRVRILDGGMFRGEPVGTRVLLVLETDELPGLHKTLQIKKQSSLRRCSCLGDLTIELLGANGRLARFSFHYHEAGLLGSELWDRDAELIKGDALLLLLAQRGIPEPRSKLLAAQRIKEEGYPRIEVRRARFPLPALQKPEPKTARNYKKLVADINNARTSEQLLWAADQLAEQELLGTRSALLAQISDRVWERLLASVGKSRPTAQVVRVEHGERVARAQRALERQRAGRTDAALRRIGRSEHGAFGSLATDGVDLYSTTNQQLIRIALSDGTFSSVSDLPGADVELSCCGPSLIFTCASTGTVGRMQVGEFRHEVLAANRERPHMPFHCGWHPRWIERDQRSPKFTVLAGIAKKRDAWNEKELTWLSMLSSSPAGIDGDDGFIFVLDQVEAGKTQLKWLGHDGMHFESVAPTEHVEPGPGRPLLAQSSTELFWPANHQILAAGKLRLEYTVRATASGPIAAIIPSESGLYTLIGRPQDRTWHVEFAAAGQSTTERIGSFDRRESDRVAAVGLAETLYFVCGQELYCAWSRFHSGAENR